MTRQELDNLAELAALNARCTRCDVVVMASPTPTATVYGSVRAPAVNAKHNYTLCGGCGRDLWAFLYAFEVAAV